MGFSKPLTAKRRAAFSDRFSPFLCDLCGKKVLWRKMASIFAFQPFALCALCGKINQNVSRLQYCIEKAMENQLNLGYNVAAYPA